MKITGTDGKNLDGKITAPPIVSASPARKQIRFGALEVADTLDSSTFINSDSYDDQLEYYTLFKDAMYPHYAGLDPKTADSLVKCKKLSKLTWQSVDSFIAKDKPEEAQKICEENMKKMEEKLKTIHRYRTEVPTSFTSPTDTTLRHPNISDMQRYKSESALMQVPPELSSIIRNESRENASVKPTVMRSRFTKSTGNLDTFIGGQLTLPILKHSSSKTSLQ